MGYGSATSACDLVPAINEVVLGDIGGGEYTVSAFGFERSLSLPGRQGIRLYDVLPCDRLIL